MSRESMTPSVFRREHTWTFCGSSNAAFAFNLGCLVQLIREGGLPHLRWLVLEGPNVLLLGPLSMFYTALCDPAVYMDIEQVADYVCYPLMVFARLPPVDWLKQLQVLPYAELDVHYLERKGVFTTLYSENAAWGDVMSFDQLDIRMVPTCTFRSLVIVTQGLVVPEVYLDSDETLDFFNKTNMEVEVASSLAYTHKIAQSNRSHWILCLGARTERLEEARDLMQLPESQGCMTLIPMLNIGEADETRAALEQNASFRRSRTLDEHQSSTAVEWGQALVTRRFEIYNQALIHAHPTAPSPDISPRHEIKSTERSPTYTPCGVIFHWFQRRFSTPAPTPRVISVTPRAVSLPSKSQTNTPRRTHTPKRHRTQVIMARSKDDLDISERQRIQLGLQLGLFLGDE